MIQIDMEMPKNCCECKIRQWDIEDDFCPFSGVPCLSIGRQNGCPLVEIPPHGDLIDRDAMLKAAKDSDNWCYDLTDLEEFASYLPSVIPATESNTSNTLDALGEEE